MLSYLQNYLWFLFGLRITLLTKKEKGRERKNFESCADLDVWKESHGGVHNNYAASLQSKVKYGGELRIDVPYF